MKLLKAFCKGVGLDDQWKKGVITPDDCVGKAGVVKIGIWDGKNSINWFIESEDKPKPKDKAAEFYNDIDEAAGEGDFPF